MNRAELAKMIDHSELHPDATRLDIDRLCTEAVAHGFATVCVNSAWTSHCAAGGIRTYAQARALIEAGANRIGASAGIGILADAPEAE